VGAFLYDLAGIQQAPGTVGWTHALVWPAVTDHPALPFAGGSRTSVAGRLAVDWTNTTGTSSGQCAAGVPENVNVTLSCGGGANTITGVAFASFGTPTGSCAGGFAVDSSCNAANSSSVIAALCVGKPSCTFFSATTLFGDPCFRTVKHLDVQVTCSAATTGLTLTATVPTNTVATVMLPFPIGTPAGNVTVTEGGTNVWAGGAYVPGVPGITGASIVASVPAVAVEVQSGIYAFSLSAVV